MGHSTEPATASPQATEQAHALWHNFVKMSTWFILGVVILLSLMAFFFIGLR